MPVGNGRTGSLVWTTPSALHFQINRVDVFAAHAGTVGYELMCALAQRVPLSLVTQNVDGLHEHRQGPP